MKETLLGARWDGEGNAQGPAGQSSGVLALKDLRLDCQFPCLRPCNRKRIRQDPTLPPNSTPTSFGARCTAGIPGSESYEQTLGRACPVPAGPVTHSPRPGLRKHRLFRPQLANTPSPHSSFCNCPFPSAVSIFVPINTRARAVAGSVPYSSRYAEPRSTQRSGDGHPVLHNLHESVQAQKMS